jgi:xylan 1,4-beta-xylosidase
MDDFSVASWMGEYTLSGQQDERELVGVLPAPSQLQLEAGLGQITLRWHEVAGAFGYTVFRAESPEGPFVWVDHGGGDNLTAVPGPTYVDTTIEPSKRYWYAIASMRAPGSPAGPLSQSVDGQALEGGVGVVVVHVAVGRAAVPIQPIWSMLGSEHLSFLFEQATLGGIPIGEDLHQALAMAKKELGTEYVRAHGVFLDDLEIMSKPAAATESFHFDKIDAMYDTILGLGLKPVVELSFMLQELADDPSLTVFTYHGGISKPQHWDRWAELVRAFCQHLVDRYGLEVIRTWGFEVWNEPNLEAFWKHSFDDYMMMYAVSTKAVKGVDSLLRVGGPATAATGWIAEFLETLQNQGLPLDFLSTHLYGSPPSDLRPLLAAYGFPKADIWWTEWGVTPTHFSAINDSVFGASFMLHGMKRTQGRADYLAYWVVSDQFEELGRADRLFHGGFGLLTVGHLRKPRFWAMKLLNDLGTDSLAVEMTGDGAASLVEALATKKPDGTVDVLVWNGTLNQAQYEGCAALDRVVEINLTGLDRPAYRVQLARIDEYHSNIGGQADPGLIWPTEEEWCQLREKDVLDETMIADGVQCPDQTFSHRVTLPMPGVLRLRMEPTTTAEM